MATADTPQPLMLFEAIIPIASLIWVLVAALRRRAAAAWGVGPMTRRAISGTGRRP